MPYAPRSLTDHRLNGANNAIEILVMDEPSEGGMNHEYEMRFHTEGGLRHQRVSFQNGPIGEAGVNGVTNEALITIVLDRLRGAQGVNSSKTGVAGKYHCKENARSITHLEEALMWLQKRTIERLSRGVEGQNKA